MDDNMVRHSHGDAHQMGITSIMLTNDPREAAQLVASQLTTFSEEVEKAFWGCPRVRAAMTFGQDLQRIRSVSRLPL